MFLIDMFNRKTTMPTADTALPGRGRAAGDGREPFRVRRPSKGPYPDGARVV